LYLPGTQAIRLYVRIASFAIALAVLGWVLLKNGPRARPHPARPWVIAALAYVSLMVLHPLTSSTTAGLAQVVLYLSVIAPLFWAPAVIRDPDHAARLMGLLLVCNGVNALVGVLQVYDPGRWMPQEVSRIVTESAFGLGAVTYQGPNGLIVRPPGLFDNPGAVAGPGMYAALLGVVFAMSAAAPWKRALALGASFAGIAAIYLSHVRVSLVVCLVMLASYVAILMAQNRRMRASRVAGTALVLVVATFAFALALGGRSIGERTWTLVETDPLTLYSASRGDQLVYTFDELLTVHPLGAGLGRWGMVGGYFGRGGDPESTPLWAEIQITGWAIDGGLPLLALSLAALALTLQSQRHVALRDPDAKVRACAAVALAANLGTAALVFSFTPFVTQIGVQFWFLAGAVHGIATRAVRHR
ncbi:MAG TPA: hypothetical protein VLD67_13690, partial [Vicinamibacterales bacterium]|nr:hypothetical protein [Vicinamibacterales bacterium]